MDWDTLSKRELSSPEDQKLLKDIWEKCYEDIGEINSYADEPLTLKDQVIMFGKYIVDNLLGF